MLTVSTEYSENHIYEFEMIEGFFLKITRPLYSGSAKLQSVASNMVLICGFSLECI